jgi:hypothetical protein
MIIVKSTEFINRITVYDCQIKNCGGVERSTISYNNFMRMEKI